MSKKTVKTSAEANKKRVSKEPKLDAIYFVLDLPNLSVTDRLVLMHLIKRARYCPKSRLKAAGFYEFDDGGYYTKYTQDEIAKEMKVKRNTISATIKKLHTEGLIHNHKGFRYGAVSRPAAACIPIDKMVKSWLDKDKPQDQLLPSDPFSTSIHDLAPDN